MTFTSFEPVEPDSVEGIEGNMGAITFNASKFDRLGGLKELHTFASSPSYLQPVKTEGFEDMSHSLTFHHFNPM